MEENRNPIETLTEQASELYELQFAITHNVNAARANGASWAEIGRALGITKQAAQQKYGKKPAAPAAPATDPLWLETPALDAPADPEPATAHREKDYRDEEELLRFSKATQRFIGQAEKRGLSYKIEVNKPLSDEPRHQLTVTVEDPHDAFHYLYWIQTHGVFTWTTNKNPNHSLSYCTGTGSGGPKKLAQNRAGAIMDTFK